jgi:hypothetical protein
MAWSRDADVLILVDYQGDIRMKAFSLALTLALTLGAVFFLAGCASLQSPSKDVSMQKSWTGDTSPCKRATGQAISEGKRVSLAILVKCSTVFSQDHAHQYGVDPDLWNKACASRIENLFIQGYLDEFAKFKNFTVVDRGTLDKIYDELALSANPEISEETRLKIGSLTSATHILVTSSMRTLGTGPGKYNDELSSRLIEVETGKIIAAQTAIVPANEK